jgi:hypothetical protein
VRRWDLAVFLGVLLGPALLLGSCVALRQRTGDLEERLVRESTTVLSASHPRVVHTGAAHPGSFGDALAGHLQAIEELAPAKREELEPLRAVVSGAAPLSSLPPRSAELFRRAGPDLDAILAGTRAERADLPADRDVFMPIRGATWKGFQLAALLAGLRARTELEVGRAQSAASACLDGLAMGRDAALGGGLIGRMVQVELSRRLVPPCATAIAALPGGAAREALAQVRRVRDTLPPFSETLREELVWVELSVYGQSLAPSAAARLGPRAPAILAESTPVSFWARLALRDGWRDVRRHHDLLVALAQLPPEARDRAIEAAQSKLSELLNPLTQVAPPYVHYARRADAGRQLLDALALAAAASTWRAENGSWPEDVELLASAGMLTDDEAERLDGAEFEPTEGEGGLVLAAPLPHGDAGQDPDEIRLHLPSSR